MLIHVNFNYRVQELQGHQTDAEGARTLGGVLDCQVATASVNAREGTQGVRCEIRKSNIPYFLLLLLLLLLFL